MTIKEIICTIKEALRVSTDYDPYAEGYQDALIWFSDMLDTLEPSWHPYPDEKPTEDGAYLITRYTKHGGIFIDIDSWISEYEMFDSTEDIPSSMKVLAWMELPKPYKKEDE